MLVRITNRCTMGCSHCLADATPGGIHMTEDVFHATRAFLEHFPIRVIFLSGGEPTEHPKLREMLRELRRGGYYILLLSNGLFLTEQPALRDDVLQLVDGVQVTNDERYYPRRIENYEHSAVSIERQLRVIFPAGRAISNELVGTAKAPHCFNIRSATRTIGRFAAARYVLAAQGKSLCAPSINIDGTVVAGETPTCMPIGNVNDDLDTITKNLIKMHCSRCGLVEKLAPVHRAAIGE